PSCSVRLPQCFQFDVITRLSPHCFFFFNDSASTEIYTLSLHDALPISDRICDRKSDSDPCRGLGGACLGATGARPASPVMRRPEDRKSTRLNSSHVKISYAVFCLKKKKKTSNSRPPYTQQERNH